MCYSRFFYLKTSGVSEEIWMHMPWNEVLYTWYFSNPYKYNFRKWSWTQQQTIFVWETRVAIHLFNQKFEVSYSNLIRIWVFVHSNNEKILMKVVTNFVRNFILIWKVIEVRNNRSVPPYVWSAFHRNIKCIGQSCLDADDDAPFSRLLVMSLYFTQA